MKLYKNLRTGMHHYVKGDKTLCKSTNKPVNQAHWVMVDAEVRNPALLICYRCDELAGMLKRKNAKIKSTYNIQRR